MTQERDESNERSFCASEAHVMTMQKLQESQSREQQLRDALEAYRGQVDQYGKHSSADALAAPQDTAALDRACKLYAANVLEGVMGDCEDNYDRAIMQIRIEKLRKEAE
jgi:hypothetical protein